MWYVIIGSLIFWALYHYSKKKNFRPTIPVSDNVDIFSWEVTKEHKEKSLRKLKKSFIPSSNNEEALTQSSANLVEFHNNHGQFVQDILFEVHGIEFPDDLIKRELKLRKEINNYYKNRGKLKSKAIAIQLAFEHAKLQLQNPNNDWKNFAGLQKLRSNWKSEEYFYGLLVLMTAFKNTFRNSWNAERLSSDIQRMFELWNSQNIALQHHNDLLTSYETAQSDFHKHLIITFIIEYLERRNKFNPNYKEELIEWCLKDVELYESFLKGSHFHEIFTYKQRMEFYDHTYIDQKKLDAISFERVKKLKSYMVPRLNSYDTLDRIYTLDKSIEKLQWLKDIGDHIGYIKKVPTVTNDKIEELFDHIAIIREIKVFKSGQKGKLGFLNSKGYPCSTEEAFKDDAEQKGWRVMRAEVSFWQAMFCLSFWDAIFEGMESPFPGYDIPYDLFQRESFYLNRKQSIDSRYKQIKQTSVPEFINSQIKSADGSWTRLIYNGDQDMMAYAKSPIVQEFISRISPDTFAKIVYRIAQNPSENRSGVFDFVIWNDQELKMIEVKRIREKIRESQKSWLIWMIQEDITAEIVRVKGV